MMQAKILKDMINMISDDAIVMLNGNPKVNIESVTVENTSFDYLSADLKLTDGFRLCTNSFMDCLFEQLRNKK